MKFPLKSRFFINLIILLLIFTVSILVRLDNLKDPMGRHHEWLTGHVLSTVSIMEKDGAAYHYYSPVWTFNTEADRYIVSTQEFKDKNNFTYYVSYPPLCFLLPYAIFKVTGTEASVIGIRVIGLVVQFFTALFIFFIVSYFFNKKINENLFIPSYIGFFLYSFASGNLWFHGHVFFADMLVPLFIASFLYFFLKTLDDKFSVLKSSVLLFVCCFLGAYTEWQMLFVAFFSSILFFILGFKSRKNFIYFLVICVATLAPVFLTYYQYSKIAGVDVLYKVISSKYKQRSGTDAQSAEAGMNFGNSFSFENISKHYENNYSTLLDFAWYCLLIFLAVFIVRRLSGHKTINIKHWAIIGILFLSILLHHIVFFNFTAVHDFSTLKTSLLLSVFSAYVLGLVYTSIDALSKKTLYALNIIVLAGAGLFYHFSVLEYYRVNQHGLIYKAHRALAEVSLKHIKPNEIFITNVQTSPETSWYTKRTIIEAKTFPEALNVLTRINSTKNGVFIKFNATDYEVIRFNTKGDTLSIFKDVFGNLNTLK